MDVKVGTNRVTYEQQGSGEPLLLVHGWGGSHNSLTALANLAAHNFKVIWLDLPGFGNSDNPPTDWGTGEYAEFVREFLKSIGETSVHYFGHSFGGSLGVYLASHYPDCIRSLILCDISYKRTAIAKTETGLFPRLKQSKLLRPVKRLAYRILYPHSDALRYPHLESNFRKIITYDLTGELKQIKKSTLILWGETDTQTPLSLATDLEQGIVGSKLVTFPNIGHALPLTHPDLVYTEIKQFIKQLNKGSEN